MQIPNCLTTLSSNFFARVVSSQKIPVPRGSKAQTPQISNSTEKKVDALEIFLKSGGNLLLPTEAHPIVITWDYWFTVLLVECFHRDVV